MQDSDRQNQELLSEINRKEEEIVVLRGELDEIIATKERDLATKDEQVASTRTELATARRELAAKDEQQVKMLAIKDAKIQQQSEVHSIYIHEPEWKKWLHYNTQISVLHEGDELIPKAIRSTSVHYTSSVMHNKHF